MNVSDFIRLFQLRAQNIMWFLGAGASAAAGVPTAYHFIWRFKQMLYCAEQHVSIKTCSDLGDQALQNRLQQYFDSKGGFPNRNSDDEYAHYFETAIPDEGDRRRYIENALAGSAPSYGHIALGALMKLVRTRIVWTTNFDYLVEDAAGTVYESSSRLTTATPDAPRLATEAIREERYPILVKLHGDFRSRRLKNTSEELRAQDAELRRNLIETCKRFGLAVVGYSGRDHSVMDALEKVVHGGGGFPFGLFWFQRPESPCSERVLQLIEKARQAGSQAEIIEADTFDELFADLLLMIPDVPEDIQKHLDRRGSRISNAPMATDKGSWPVMRLNALPVTSAPSICRRVVCQIGGTKEVRDVIKEAGSAIIAGRRKVGVIAFGRDSEIRRVFDPYQISEFDLHTIESRRLRYESTEHGLLYEALCRALERERPLKIFHRRTGHIVAVDPDRRKDALWQSLTKATKQICGMVGDTRVLWAEAIRIRIEHRIGSLWLLIEPTIWVEPTDNDRVFEISREFIKERLATRYNAVWNSIVEAWANIITCGQKECTLRAFGISDGCDASFSVSRVTAFSWREKAS